MKTIIGRKVGMTQIFDEKGAVIPVTVIEAGPCPVVQIKTVETDGYNAVQLGFGDVKEYKVNPEAYLGHVGDISTVIRVVMTGRCNTPDLYEILRVIGKDSIDKRIKKI